MAWEIPTPTEIADQASTDIEEGMKAILEARGVDQTIDARSEYSVLRVIAVVIGLALYPVYLFFSWVLEQLFPDRCSETWLAAHARIWGIERVAATKATGSVIFIGAEDTSIALGTILTLSATRWQTTEAATMPSAGSISVAVEALVAGAAGNRTVDTELALEVPIIGLTSQVATVGTGGLSGGTDQQSVDDWRTALLARIRERGNGGSSADYEAWAAEIVAPARVAVIDAWVGIGTVGVAVAMSDGSGGFRSPTNVELATLQAGLDERKPVTATVYALAAVPKTIDVTAAISPFSTSTKQAVEAAAIAFFQGADVQIGEKLHRSRLGERLSRAAGEQWHVLSAPATDPVMTALQFPALGNLFVTEAT